MSRRLVLTTLIASMLIGCGVSPTTVKRQHVDTTPVTKTVTGVPGIAPTVSVKADVAAVAPAVAVRSQDSTADVVQTDSMLESVELLSPNGAGYHVQGWFGDMVDKIKDAYKRWKLSREVKAALKKKDEDAFNIHGDEIAAMQKDRTAPITKIKGLATGDQEIITTWDSKYQGTWHVETARIIDTDGVTQVLAVSVTGKDKKDQAVDISRTRSLLNEQGSYQVITTKKVTDTKGRIQNESWTKTVKADGSETILGKIVFPDGWTAVIDGSRGTDKKVKVDVTKIAPAPAASADPGATADAGATP